MTVFLSEAEVRYVLFIHGKTLGLEAEVLELSVGLQGSPLDSIKAFELELPVARAPISGLIGLLDGRKLEEETASLHH